MANGEGIINSIDTKQHVRRRTLDMHYDVYASCAAVPMSTAHGPAHTHTNTKERRKKKHDTHRLHRLCASVLWAIASAVTVRSFTVAAAVDCLLYPQNAQATGNC